jgi:hypothetical protein
MTVGQGRGRSRLTGRQDRIPDHFLGATPKNKFAVERYWINWIKKKSAAYVKCL